MPGADSKILLDAMNLPPDQAIAFFKAKGFAITWDWHEMAQEAHTKAFTVAKAMSSDVLKDIHEMTAKALTEGITFRQFQKELEPRLKAKGWWGKQEIMGEDGTVKSIQLGSPWRLKTIFQTNLQSAYMAGREREMREVAKFRPFWQYVAVLDSMTRPTHRELNGKIFRHDDPFWEHFFPPNGFNCRCQVRSLSQREVDRDGLQVISSAGKLTETTGHDPISNRVFKTTKFVSPDTLRSINPDEGFDLNPSRVQERLLELERQKRQDAEKAVGKELPEIKDPNPVKISQPKPDETPSSKAPKTSDIEPSKPVITTPEEPDSQVVKPNEKSEALHEEEKAREMGVEADYGGQPIPGNLMNQVLEEERQAKHPLPPRVVVGDNPKYPWGENIQDPALFEDRDQTIYLNPAYPWHRSDEITQEEYRAGQWSTDSSYHPIRHEIAHWLRYRASPDQYRILKEGEFRPEDLLKITDKVSLRALDNPLEFIAEVYAGLRNGKRFDDGVMEVYRFFGGPNP